MEKIALLEIGTTHVRVTLCKKAQDSHFHIYKKFSEYVHINEHIEVDGMIKSGKVYEVVAILKMYKKICDADGIKEYLCYASESLTKAKNYKSFIDELGACIGQEFKIMTPEQETNAIYTAIVNTLDVTRGVIVNISSFNTRIIHYNRRMILDSVIIPFGSVSLFEKSDNMPLIATDLFEKEIIAKAPWLKNLDPETQIVGVSDVFASFGKIARKMDKYPLEIEHNYTASNETFYKVFDFIKGLDMDKKQKLKGISSHSAKTIVCGMCIIDAILKQSGLKTMVNANAHRNTGILYNNVIPSTIEKPISDLMNYSLNTIIDVAGLDKEQARRQYDLSILLFKQIRVLHKLPRTYAKPLHIASCLYRLGQFGGNYNAILTANVFGASHKDIILAAFASSFKRWEDFNLAEWVKYKELLTDEDLDAVRKMSMILSMAEALDIRGNEIIKDISCDLLGDSVIIKLMTNQDAKASKVDVSATDVEIFHAKKYAKEFAKTFKRQLELL